MHACAWACAVICRVHVRGSMLLLGSRTPDAQLLISPRLVDFATLHHCFIFSPSDDFTILFATALFRL